MWGSEALILKETGFSEIDDFLEQNLLSWPHNQQLTIKLPFSCPCDCTNQSEARTPLPVAFVVKCCKLYLFHQKAHKAKLIKPVGGGKGGTSLHCHKGVFPYNLVTMNNVWTWHIFIHCCIYIIKCWICFMCQLLNLVKSGQRKRHVKSMLPLEFTYINLVMKKMCNCFDVWF